MADKLEIQILEDGTVKVSSDQISVGNHRSADQLLQLIETLMGGEVKTDGKIGRAGHHRGTSHDNRQGH